MIEHTKNGRCAYILGGQPGAGKSTFYSGNESLDGYITIDGDQYRKYHPRYEAIVKYDLDNYADRTQSFVNKVVEQLIEDLSEKGYDIIVEGTLRNPNVSIKTCGLLKEKGYNPKLVVIACDAEQSWKSTIFRAKFMQEIGEKPRLVPIDKYNAIVNAIPESLAVIVGEKCFDSISIINRNNEVLYRQSDNTNPSSVLKDVLNLKNWNEKFLEYAREYMDAKMELIKRERDMMHEQNVSCAHEEMSPRER